LIEPVAESFGKLTKFVLIKQSNQEKMIEQIEFIIKNISKLFNSSLVVS
jgi:hypothetical protein